MQTEADKLLRLQEVDGRLEILRRELAARPRVLRAHDARAAELTAAIARAEEALKGKKLEIDKSNLDLKSAESRIQETKAKVAAVKTNQEFTAINSQIARLEQEKGTFEERVLKAWEELEQLKVKVENSKKDLGAARRARDEDGKVIDKEIEEIGAEVARYEAQRRELLAPIDKELLNLYQRLYPRYLDRTIVSAEGMICAGCHMTLSPQIANQLMRNSGIVLCTNCSRILHL